ncbi:MAG TPA: septum formation initiator family protein, partial [Burkholderiales bacterium]|nr:septum formation initiator family protein [Burkholderiales bacterium]
MRNGSSRTGPAFRRKIFILGLVCLFLVMVVTSIFGKKGVMDILRARQKLAELDVEARRLELEKARLESEVRALETNPRAVEKEARDKLWLIKPGEKVLVVPKTP